MRADVQPCASQGTLPLASLIMLLIALFDSDTFGREAALWYATRRMAARFVGHELAISASFRVLRRPNALAMSAQRSSVRMSANNDPNEGSKDSGQLAKVVMRMFLRASQTEETVQELAKLCADSTSWSKSMHEQVRDVLTALGLRIEEQYLTPAATADCGVIEGGTLLQRVLAL